MSSESNFNMPRYLAQGFWMLVCALCCVIIAAISVITPDLESADHLVFGVALAVLGLLSVAGLVASCYMLRVTSGA